MAGVRAGCCGRTVERQVRHTVLWHGNVETPLWTVFTDREHIMRSAVHAYPRSRARTRAMPAN
jgi:hypothetical protein